MFSKHPIVLLACITASAVGCGLFLPQANSVTTIVMSLIGGIVIGILIYAFATDGLGSGPFWRQFKSSNPSPAKDQKAAGWKSPYREENLEEINMNPFTWVIVTLVLLGVVGVIVRFVQGFLKVVLILAIIALVLLFATGTIHF